MGRIIGFVLIVVVRGFFIGVHGFVGVRQPGAKVVWLFLACFPVVQPLRGVSGGFVMSHDEFDVFFGYGRVWIDAEKGQQF